MPADNQILVDNQLVTKKHAAQILDCSISHINELMSKGKLRFVYIGPRAVRITVKSLKEFIGEVM